MLFVDRTAVDLPISVTNALRNGLKDAIDFYKRPGRAQERFEYETRPWTITHRPYLSSLFSDTCAFCECEESFSPLSVEHFRPRSEATDLEGRSDPDAYWWLACEWENLYLVCKHCAFQKKNFFPIAGKRAKPRTTGAALRREKPLLLDPCYDKLYKHLRFDSGGRLFSISQHAGVNPKHDVHDRGATTISILALNRPELVRRRSEEQDRCYKEFDRVSNKRVRGKTLYGDILALFEEFVDQFQPLVALKRQIVVYELLTRGGRLSRALRKFDSSRFAKLASQIRGELSVGKYFLDGKPAIKPVAPATILSPVKIDFDNAYVRRVEIHNFKSVTNFSMSMDEMVEVPDDYLRFSVADLTAARRKRRVGKKHRASWKMLLGENAAGKSSILKAIAIALMGEEQYKRQKKDLQLEDGELFNKHTRKKDGYIRVELSQGEPIEIRLTREELIFQSGKRGADGCYVRGFGSARLFSGSDRRSDRDRTVDEPLQDVANLFHPEILLSNPEIWLRDVYRVSRRKFDRTALTLRDLYDLPREVRKPLRLRLPGIITLNTGRGDLPLRDQSDGYNSLLALVVDILAGVRAQDVSKVAGIVFVDEIESHLHPRWKMGIVDSLRKAFPRMQFLATTHDPLCLRGLADNEILVLERDGRELIAREPRADIDGMRVDQLLTSRFFGLASTFDKNVEARFNKYYDLLSGIGDDNLTPDGKRQLLAQLSEELSQYNQLGDSPRDRAVYKLVDKYIARDRARSAEIDTDKIVEEVKDKAFAIWDRVRAARKKK